MSVISVSALPLVKQRLSRLSTDTTIDVYLVPLIDSSESELENMTGVLDGAEPEDLMLLVDYSVWRYQSRDQAGREPEWLRFRIRNRFLRNRG